MAVQSGGQAVVRVLEQEQVQRIFCVPGESFLSVLDALHEHSSIELIVNRHENGAAFMAEAYAKATGEVGVCMATRGVGVANLAIGLHTAMQDSTPVVALIGQVERSFRGREAFQEVDLKAMFAHLCKWTAEIDDVRRVPEVLHRAFHMARWGRPGPVLVALPHDMLEEYGELPDWKPLERPVVRADNLTVARAMELIRAAKRPILIAGGGIRSARATEELARFAESNALPVVSAFRRFDVLPNTHRCYAGWLGFGSAAYVVEAIKNADLIVAMGTRFSQVTTQDYSLLPPQTPLIHIDISPEVFGKVYPTTIPVQSDAKQFLIQALPLSKLVDERRTYAEELHNLFLDFSSPSAAQDGEYVDLKGMMHDVHDLAPRNLIIASDAGNFFGWVVKYSRFGLAPSYIGPTSGAMGYGLPAALATKLAFPHRPVLSFSGDGGFMMTMQELETAVRYQIPVIAIVINNNLYGTIRAHQEKHFPKRVTGTELGNPNFAQLAQTFGAHGFRTRSNSEFRQALAQALELTQQEGRPVLIEVLSNPGILSVSAQV